MGFTLEFKKKHLNSMMKNDSLNSAELTGFNLYLKIFEQC